MAFNQPATRDTTIESTAITSVTPQVGSGVDIGQCQDYILDVNNSLNQAGNIQMSISTNGGAGFVDFGAPIALGAASGYTLISLLATKPLFGIIRATYTASIAPASGTLKVTIHRKYI